MNIKVWPTKKSAVGMKHPHGPVLSVAGTDWPHDSFTSRRLVDGSVSREEKDAFKEASADATSAVAPPTENAEPETETPSA